MSATSAAVPGISILKDIIETLQITPWKQIWEQKLPFITAFGAFLCFLLFLMILKDRFAKRRKLVSAVTYAVIVFSFIYTGLILKAQPTTTNIVILLNGVISEGSFPLGLYILEPFIFLSFLFIFFTVVLWGRGVFCGWVCPYGAMTELLNRLYKKYFRKFQIGVPEKVHWKLIYLKYVIFAIILGVSFYSFMLSEYLSEVEPFKTFVLKLMRPWQFVLYFVMITAGSVMIYRAYCRYLCPLGAALAIPSFFKLIPLIKLKRHDLCGKCKICGRECNYQAVRPDGRIYAPECMECLECQVNYWDEDKCPALIKQKVRSQKSEVGIQETSNSKLVILFILLLLPSIIHAKTLSVSTEYSSISDALKKAADGDVIEVKGGEYREKIAIEKAVYLKGINGPVVIGGAGYIIKIISPDVTVEGFTLRDETATSNLDSAAIFITKSADNAVVRNSNLYNVMHGIWSVGARGIRVEDNYIEGKKNLDRNYRGNGIYLTDSQEAVIAGNHMEHCRDGMYLEVSHDGKVTGNDIRNSRYAIHTMWVDRSVFSGNTAVLNLVGIAIMYSKGSQITDNLAAGNQTHGLLLNQTTRSDIRNNTLIGNTKGVYFYNSVFNSLNSNLIMNNSLGLHSWGGSEDNTVEENSFIQNEVQVKFVAGRDQKWDGNYWSDYIGWDMTDDGIGDLSYESNTVVDHILWRYPSAKLLLASSSLQLLWMIEKQFPIMKVPRVIDSRPVMLPLHRDWKELKAKYPYAPERYYGEIEKMPLLH